MSESDNREPAWAHVGGIVILNPGDLTGDSYYPVELWEQERDVRRHLRESAKANIVIE